MVFFLQFDLASITDKMAEMEGDEETPKIKLGDASCAAPFTSKLSHVAASEHHEFSNLPTLNFSFEKLRTSFVKAVAPLWQPSKCIRF